MIPKPLEISLMVTTDCQANCEHCCQSAWRKHNPGYHMSLDELRSFIDYTKQSEYIYDLIIISGGEPFLWDNIFEGIQLLRLSGIAREISIFSNGLALEKFNPTDFNFIYQMVNSIRVTNLGFNSKLFLQFKNWLSLRKKFYFIDYSNFFIIPDNPVPNSLPADCGCPHFSFTQGKLNICTLALDIYYRLSDKSNIHDKPFGFPLCKNYLDNIISQRTFSYNICLYCISNNNVRSQLKPIPNKSLNKEARNV